MSTTSTTTKAPIADRYLTEGYEIHVSRNRYGGRCVCGCRQYVDAGDGRLVRRIGYPGWQIVRRNEACTASMTYTRQDGSRLPQRGIGDSIELVEVQ